VPVYAGEMAAIRTALEYVKQLSSVTGKRKHAIFSDSLSSIAALKRGSCQARPNLFGETIASVAGTDADTVLVWVPSHIGVAGNEKADQL
jgi:ribonuclease HI